MKRILLLFIGIFIALFCLEILLQTSSLVLEYANKISNSQEIKTKVEAKDKNLIKILCIGESTTFYQYPKMLPYFLDKKTEKDYVVIDCGIPGTNIRNITERINEQIKYYHPDIIITMMGINDALFNKRTIYKKYPIKIFNLFFIIKRNIENIVATKLYAEGEKTDYQKIVDEYFNTGKGLEKLVNIVNNNPRDIEAIKILIQAYRMKNNNSQIEKYSEFFFKYNKPDSSILSVLTDCYIKQGKYKEAYNLIRSVINNKNNNELNDDQKDRYFSDIVESFTCYSTLEHVKKYYNILTSNKVETSILDNLYNYLKTNNVKVKYYFYKNKYKHIAKQPVFNTDEIKEAYLYIAKQIIDKDITYICMGYPTLPIQTFKNFFEDTNLLNKIYFVSNEYNFKDALNKYSYYQIFRDNFAGAFGHCTDYGNQLIAKNLAETISKLIE